MADKKREAIEWGERAEQFFQKGRLKEAEECYRTSIDLDKKNAIVWAMYGTTLKDQGKLDESLKAFKRYFKLEKPPNPAVQLNYASLLKMRQEFKEAEKTYKLVVKAMPDFALAWYDFGNLYLDQSMWLDAAHNYDKALRCDLDDNLRINCLWNKSTALKERGELLAAEAALREALEIDPSNEAIKILLEQTSPKQEREQQIDSTLRDIKYEGKAMEFDYMDEKCPKCGHNDLNWRIEDSVITYNVYTCNKCQSSFRVTTQGAPDYSPETGHKVTMLPDTCVKCGEKSVAYSHSTQVIMGTTLFSSDFLRCNKCGILMRVAGDVTTQE
ncbi:MAG: tetratricopeptide repeat protein [Candidatus Thorarchaeota archaeon]|jgi:tetratricopeptide (TPR) repeat protein